MKHRLKISVSNHPPDDAVVACKGYSIRKRVLDRLFGPIQKVMVIVPGQTVDTISIKEIEEGGIEDAG